MNALEKAAIKPYDMVVVNLCPFEKIAIENTGDIDSMVNNIDIVGCALLRAAAKNYKNVTVITDKIDYYVALNANDFGRLISGQSLFHRVKEERKNIFRIFR